MNQMMTQTTQSNRIWRFALIAGLAALPLTAEVLPVNLPAPSPTDKGVKDKPVKVYILSGQSNMLGFGRVENADPYYSQVFLSADPATIECKLPINNTALLKFGVYQSADAEALAGGTAKIFKGSLLEDPKAQPVKETDFALGSVDAELPAIDGPHTLVVNAFIEVPRDGSYQLRVGMDSSSNASAQLAGTKVYHKKKGENPILTTSELKKGTRYPIQIIYSEGGSAALWMEQVELEGMGDLRHTVEKLGRFPYMTDDQGEWTVRHDVMLNDAYMGKGKSAPLSAPACGPTFGPELGFGYVMGAYHDEPVIVMKADIGNRSLAWDILPPGSESYTYDGKEYPGYKEMYDPDGKVIPWDGKGWYAGKQYDDYTASVRAVLDNFDEKYPEYADQGFEVAGFVWWQGHKDGGNPAHIANYEKNLANLIKAWRKEFNAPKAKWSIATVGFNGEDMPENYQQIAQAQMAVADPEIHPEFAGTVKTIDTRPFWRGAEVSPKDQSYHYNHNAETYILTGDALGRAMVELYGGKVEYPKGEMDSSLNPIPMMPAPGDEEMKALQQVIRPIITDKIIPEYVASAEGTPGYRRNGMKLGTILNKTLPEKPNGQVTSQLDTVIDYYNLIGIDDYNWKPAGPEMRLSDWHYLSFDPAEKKTDSKGDRYREVTLPEGTANWAAADFDPAKAGWETGKAPFGQNKGELEALRDNCGNLQCRCDVTPNTLWDKEVLLIQQQFDIPEFEEGKRYRIVVGGAGHTWSGEGFALYVNGEQAAEMTGGYYKGGGATRGVNIHKDLQEKIEGRKTTIAVKTFLRQNGHKNKPAPPTGHLSVWLEEVQLPPAVQKLAATDGDDS